MKQLQLDLFPPVYISGNDSKSFYVTKMPSVTFGNGISESMIWAFLRAMSRGQIRIKDYQGNELKVSMY